MMKVKFVPQNVEFEIKPGESVLHVAQDHGIYVKSVCKGVPSCAECRVRLVEGEHNVLPPGSEELSLIGTGHFIDRRRLSCQLKCFGDITVDMTEQIAKQQGLIGGRKTKKAIIKDDRVEEQRAIRSTEFDDEQDSSAALRTSGALQDGSAPQSVNPQQAGELRSPSRNDSNRQSQQRGQQSDQQRGSHHDQQRDNRSRGPHHDQQRGGHQNLSNRGPSNERGEGGGSSRRRRRRGRGNGGNGQGHSGSSGNGPVSN